MSIDTKFEYLRQLPAEDRSNSFWQQKFTRDDVRFLEELAKYNSTITNLTDCQLQDLVEHKSEITQQTISFIMYCVSSGLSSCSRCIDLLRIIPLSPQQFSFSSETLQQLNKLSDEEFGVLVNIFPLVSENDPASISQELYELAVDHEMLYFLFKTFVKAQQSYSISEFFKSYLRALLYLYGHRTHKGLDFRIYKKCEPYLDLEDRKRLEPFVEEERSFYLNMNSAAAVLAGARRVLVYGFYQAHYGHVTAVLSNNPESPVYVISDDDKLVLQLDKNFSIENAVKYCKDLLCSVVLDNYEREKKGLAPTTILFCVGTNTGELKYYQGRPLIPPTPQLLLDRSSRYYSSTTSKELRRMFKLCSDIPEMSSDSEMRKLAEIARKYLIFVTVDYEETLKEFVMKRIAPPWADPTWSGLWLERKRSRRPDHQVKNEIDTWYFKMRDYVRKFKPKLPPIRMDQLP